MRLLTAIAFLALVSVPLGAADDPKEVAKKLEGTYEVLDITAGGKPEAKKDEVESFVIKDGEIIIKEKKGGREEKAGFKLDPSKSPAHFDITPGGDVVVPGIYMTKETDKGLELTIAFAKGAKGERPKDFKGAGESEIVIKLLRKKDK